ncbi:MAG TPA: hypothetical protein VG929_11490 [Actinomycetota bacterium]|nr:hypothetical protein [Actinomycetota bacterium]
MALLPFPKIPDRVYKMADRPMTWTTAIILGFVIWILAIALLGQIPSLIIYKFDQYIAEIIDFSKRIPAVNDEGLNPVQVKIVRDIIANAVQMNFLILMLAIMYFWQEGKRKRTGGRGVQDVVKGYMPGK